jgi:hypothetical protein
MRKGARAREDPHDRGGLPLQGGCSRNSPSSLRRGPRGFLAFFPLNSLARMLTI